MTERTYDVVILGAGIAGLSAAAHAREAGLDVALLEKREVIGGSSAMSGGFFAFSGTDEQAASDVTDSEELFLTDLRGAGGGHADERLLRAYLDAQTDVYRWMKARGIPFGPLEQSSGQSTARSHLTPIKDVLRALADGFVADGGTLLFEHAATSLRRENGRVTGVIVDAPGGAVTIGARLGVIVATGGFSRSAELLGIFAPEQRAAIPYGGPGNTGDGLRMAWKLGAGVTDMSFISATFGSHPDTGEDFHELLTAYYMGAIVVNENGDRFIDESSSYKTIGAACLRQPNGMGFEVFDSTVRALSHDGVPLADIGALERIGHVHKANTLEELAAIAGIDADGLAATVESYNAMVAGDAADPFGRTGLVNGVGTLVPVAQGPFYAYPAKSLMTSTYCGLTITPKAQVVDIDGDIIDGLYAIGEVTGGFHGAAYMTGTSLGKGAVFGHIVAAHLANKRERVSA